MVEFYRQFPPSQRHVLRAIITAWVLMLFCVIFIGLAACDFYAKPSPKAANLLHWFWLQGLRPTLEPFRQFNPARLQCWYLPAGLVCLFGACWVLEWPNEGPRAVLKVRLVFFKPALLAALFIAVVYGLVSSHWQPLFGLLPLIFFLIPGYVNKLGRTSKKTHPLRWFTIWLLPFLGTMFCVLWFLVTRTSDVYLLLLLLFLLFWETIPVYVPYLSLPLDGSPGRLPFHYIGVSRKSNDVIILLDYSLRPLFINPAAVEDWDVYSQFGRVMNVRVDKQFCLYPLTYPGRVRLERSDEFAVEKLRSIFLDYLEKCGSSVDSNTPIRTLFQEIYLAKMSVL